MHVDIPHRLGKEAAKARLAANTGRLADHMPGKVADVASAWQGDVLHLTVSAMGQQVVARCTVEEAVVRADIQLPALLGFFEGPIRTAIEQGGPKLLA